MKNYIFRVICIHFLLLLCCAGDIFSLSSALKAEYPTKYEYYVTLGDNLIYNVNFQVNGGFINDSVYEEMDQWVRAYAVSTNNKKLENFNDSRGLIADFFQLINRHVQIKINIAKVRRIYQNTTLPNYDRISRGYDELLGSLLIWDPINETWITPFTYFHSQIDLITPFFVSHFNIAVDDPDLNELIQDAHAYIDDEFGLTYWLNYVIQRFQTSEDYYYANGTKRPPERAPNYDPLLPQPPLDLLDMEGIPFFFPSSMNFKQWADYSAELTEYTVENPNSTIPSQSFSNLLNQGGITTFIANTHGLGIILNSQALNISFIDQLISMTVEQLESNLSISDWISYISLGLEYDENFGLASVAMYSDYMAEFDTISRILNGSDVPYLYREPFVMSANFTFVREGFFPPTPDQIQNGEIGDARDYERSTTSSTRPSIGVFSFFSFGLVAIFSCSILLLQIKDFRKKPKSF